MNHRVQVGGTSSVLMIIADKSSVDEFMGTDAWIVRTRRGKTSERFMKILAKMIEEQPVNFRNVSDTTFAGFL